MSLTPPERVSVDSITIRRWVDADAAPLHALVLANLDHLRPWMAWIAAEPLSLSDTYLRLPLGDHTRREGPRSELVGESPDEAVAPSEVGVDVTWRRRRADV